MATSKASGAKPEPSQGKADAVATLVAGCAKGKRGHASWGEEITSVDVSIVRGNAGGHGRKGSGK